uniref:Putative secreted peptide n=1 Tax=Anopheles braziliensis TaxID=58242 RepID=A0A2M3ZP55_9DIPT
MTPLAMSESVLSAHGIVLLLISISISSSASTMSRRSLSCCLNCAIQSAIGIVPPYSFGNSFGLIFFFASSQPRCTNTRFRSLSLNTDSINSDSLFAKEGKLTKWFSF